MSATPTLHILAGPNGAGKSTLYETSLKPRYSNVEFVNADLLAKQHYGHNALTIIEAETGQRLANERRAALMAERKSLITKTTFSHPSKLELVREAQAAGYRVFVHHVNVRAPEVSIARVSSRVAQGGHPVPEDKIRERYERNKAIIRAAALIADRAVVWDNSRFGQAPTKTIQLERGVATWASKEVPAWARALYAKELEHFSQARQNPAAASFADAKQFIEKLDPGARLHIARPGRYKGTVAAETALHLVQKLHQAQGADKAAGSYVAHFKKVLDRIPEIGKAVQITHTIGKISAVLSLEPVQTAEAVALSLRAAHALVKRLAGDKARIEEAQRGKSYQGPVLSETDKHIVQGGKAATQFIAHRKQDLATTPKVGQLVDVNYPKDQEQLATVAEHRAPAKSKVPPELDHER